MIGISNIKSVINKCKKHSKEHSISFVSVLIDYIWCRLRHGFDSDDYFMYTSGYDMTELQRDKIISVKRYVRLMHQFNARSHFHILQNKIDFLEYFKDFIKHDSCYPQKVNFATFKTFIKSHQKFILKPLDGSQGKGIREYIPNDNLENDFAQLKKDNSYIEEKIRQHPKMNFDGDTCNTIRVYTIMDAKGEVHILKALLRGGVDGNVVDNYHCGNVIYPVNVQYGFIESYGISSIYGKEIAYHPNTNKLMIGFQIPNWRILLETVKKAAERIPQIRYIGWDIVITQDGVDFIEGNHDADYTLFEMGFDRYFYKRILKLI